MKHSDHRDQQRYCGDYRGHVDTCLLHHDFFLFVSHGFLLFVVAP
jgi:hypothetical protein